MPQTSKIIQSREEWKNKAIQRANENKELTGIEVRRNASNLSLTS